MGVRLGIFGGAFNPVHNAHVIIAILSMEYLDLDKLIIVPTFDPPHRDPEELAPFDLRYRWLYEVFKGMGGIEISDYEKVKGGKSYSIETVKHFSRVYNVKPFFLIGEDSALSFDKWYRYEELMEMASFAVYPRFKESRFDEIKKKFPSFILMDLPLIEISSTTVRERIRSGKSVRGMVPSVVEESVLSYFGRAKR